MFSIIDLSETLYQGIPVVVESIRDTYEDPPFYVDEWATIPEKGYAVHSVHMGTHTGTHIDAPLHFFENTNAIDNISLDDLIGRAVVMNFSGKGNITREMILPFRNRIENTSNIAVVISKEDEYISLEASEELISWKPKSVLVACGFNEPDELYTKSIVFLKAGIPLIQRIDNSKIHLVKDNDLIIAAPLKLKDMDAAPARVLAINGI